jgi:hypothetical protein
MLRTLARFVFNKGYDSSGNRLANDPNTMGAGSENLVITGTGKNTVFKGMATVPAVVGAQVMMNAGDDYCGLGSGSETGIGSVFLGLDNPSTQKGCSGCVRNHISSRTRSTECSHYFCGHGTSGILGKE